jgi:hypothetical protein
VSLKKSDAPAIRDFMAGLKEQSWLSPDQRGWPDSLYRFEHVEGAAAILNSGVLLSRAQAQRRGSIRKDCAAADILNQTPDRWKDCVRLYFRPLTPMQYNTEGHRPTGEYARQASCPVPVVLKFSAASILTRSSTRFSDGNLAATSRVRVGDDIGFLSSIPFHLVYHNTWMPAEQKEELTFRRHAEAIVPNELRLTALQAVLCRTAAEMETLLYLLSDGAKDRWAKCIGTKASLFYRHWSYVESVTLTNEAAVFMFHPSSRTPGPFAAEARFVVLPSSKAYLWKNDSFYTNRAAKFGAARAGAALRVGLAHAGRPSDYKVELRLDSELAYANSHHEDSVPF